ncbi:FAD-dependent oxidoreductase [Cohnella thermotolerans]|uniref:FAD-dependent oxidoreductase n=1 Tax=Cohnella thermotolerans TaxID=329858 RepID=UPI00041AB131|nr:FAD-dependent oxidoreductase [Cohnella thermotolerans]
MRETEAKADVIIIGASTGGCAAALAAAEAGKTVILTEESDWIGGQLTSQAVPPDEHPWIEQYGCTLAYRQFREGVRSYYKRNFPLKASAAFQPLFNPGNAMVSRISHEPRAALAVLEAMLAPYVHSGAVTVVKGVRPVAAETDGDRVRGVTLEHEDDGTRLTVTGAYFLDATDCGDLLPLVGAEYVTGAESAAETGEPHAVGGPAMPQDMQAFTYCFAMDYLEGEDHTIERPKQYDFWRAWRADFWPAPQLSWQSPSPRTHEPVEYALFPQGDKFSLWRYRRILDRSQFRPGLFASDITAVNWPQNDYWLGPIIDVTPEERRSHLEAAKQLSLSLLYWMQTEAPRPDGKLGYPGLRLRRDVVGTRDGLAKMPYIRESRRIRAEFTVLEQHVSPEIRGESGAQTFDDSVGIGFYHIDLHPSSGGRNYIDIPSLPFQIPLGSLLPVRLINLLPACKNIGTTHITNGCYRLHPVEWNIGEAAGALAAFCLDEGVIPKEVRLKKERLEAFQRRLVKRGVELSWP